MVRASVTLLRQSRPAFSAFPSGDASKAGAPKRAGKATAALVAPKMFEVAWGPLIGAFSQLLETSSDGAVVGLCLKGFQSAVRVAAATEQSGPCCLRRSSKPQGGR